MESKTVIIPFDCICAADRGDAMLAYAAVEREDRETVVGLIERGKAFRVVKGTRAHTVGSVTGFTLIGLETGLNAGESCWLPDRIVR